MKHKKLNFPTWFAGASPVDKLCKYKLYLQL